LLVRRAVTIPKPTNPTPTYRPDFKDFPNFMPIHRPMIVKRIGIITDAPRLIM
jgi:hypothetical protein